jgi:hypothetical protein
VVTTGSNTAEVILPGQDPQRDGAELLAHRRQDSVRLGVYNLFFNGFNGLVLKSEDRTEGGAQIAMVNADGSGFHEVTSGANNNGFPSMAPDGKRFVYRSFGPDGRGCACMNLETKAVTKLTEGYDNFPLMVAARRSDHVLARRQRRRYEIYTIKPDGTGVKRLTFSVGTMRTWPGHPTASSSSGPARASGSRMKGFTRMRHSHAASCS